MKLKHHTTLISTRFLMKISFLNVILTQNNRTSPLHHSERSADWVSKRVTDWRSFKICGLSFVRSVHSLVRSSFGNEDWRDFFAVIRAAMISRSRVTHVPILRNICNLCSRGIVIEGTALNGIFLPPRLPDFKGFHLQPSLNAFMANVSKHRPFITIQTPFNVVWSYYIYDGLITSCTNSRTRRQSGDGERRSDKVLTFPESTVFCAKEGNEVGLLWSRRFTS